jgi:glycosyltransferase involved in cell wall biosynthesis
MPQGRAGASGRVRVREWLEHLDVDHDIHDYLGLGHSQPSALIPRPTGIARAERDLRTVARRGTDVMLLHREASPLSRGSIEERLLRSAAVAVFDFDDALQWDHGVDSRLRGIAPKSLKCLRAVRAAHRVIAGNTVLADWASEWSQDVVVIPSCVNPRDYAPKHDYSVQDPPRLGWVGSPSTEQFLQLTAPALVEVHRRTGARLTVVSRGRANLGPLDAMVDRVDWASDTVAAELASFDVGIGPLRDTLLARGKCAYKLLQYAATGLPMVATPVGANRDVLQATGGGAAWTTDEWVDLLDGLLAATTDERSIAGNRARAAVESQYSFDAWANTWLTTVSRAPLNAREPAQ